METPPPGHQGAAGPPAYGMAITAAGGPVAGGALGAVSDAGQDHGGRRTGGIWAGSVLSPKREEDRGRTVNAGAEQNLRTFGDSPNPSGKAMPTGTRRRRGHLKRLWGEPAISRVMRGRQGGSFSGSSWETKRERAAITRATNSNGRRRTGRRRGQAQVTSPAPADARYKTRQVDGHGKVFADEVMRMTGSLSVADPAHVDQSRQVNGI